MNVLKIFTILSLMSALSANAGLPSSMESVLAQHLWDDEWTTPVESNEVIAEEAFQVDPVGTEETETVAGFWWTNTVNEGSQELEQLAQHLWDEEWTTPVESNEVIAEEALQVDPIESEETEAVAGIFWNQKGITIG